MKGYGNSRKKECFGDQADVHAVTQKRITALRLTVRAEGVHDNPYFEAGERASIHI
jgi:hypothetical protein